MIARTEERVSLITTSLKALGPFSEAVRLTKHTITTQMISLPQSEMATEPCNMYMSPASTLFINP